MNKNTKLISEFLKEIGYHDLKKLSGTLHGKLSISRGLKVQKNIYEVAKNSNKHYKVYHEYVLKLKKGDQKKKTHTIDIIIEEENKVEAYDSKGASFNETQDASLILKEYQKYIKLLKRDFPNKKVSYGILKESWNEKQSSRFNHLNDNGVLVHDTTEFVESNYGVNCEDKIYKPPNKETLKVVREKYEAIN